MKFKAKAFNFESEINPGNRTPIPYEKVFELSKVKERLLRDLSEVNPELRLETPSYPISLFCRFNSRDNNYLS